MAKNSESIGFKQLHGNNEIRIDDGSEKGIGAISVKIDVDVSDALKGLKAVQREAKKTAGALKEVESFGNKEKLFVIEMESIDSVPRVFYKGNEITHKTAMTMGWGTKNAFHSGDAHISIDYIEVDECGMPTNKSIREFRKPNNEITIGGI